MSIRKPNPVPEARVTAASRVRAAVRVDPPHSICSETAPAVVVHVTEAFVVLPPCMEQACVVLVVGSEARLAVMPTSTGVPPLTGNPKDVDVFGSSASAA